MLKDKRTTSHSIFLSSLPNPIAWHWQVILAYFRKNRVLVQNHKTSFDFNFERVVLRSLTFGKRIWLSLWVISIEFVSTTMNSIIYLFRFLRELIGIFQFLEKNIWTIYLDNLLTIFKNKNWEKILFSR